MPNHIHSKATMVGNGTCGHNAVRAGGLDTYYRSHARGRRGMGSSGLPRRSHMHSRVTVVGKVLQTFLPQAPGLNPSRPRISCGESRVQMGPCERPVPMEPQHPRSQAFREEVGTEHAKEP